MRIPLAAPAMLMFAVLAVATTACGGDSEPITISDARITASSNDVSAIYFTITNDGDADELLAVTTSLDARSTFHENVIDGATARMEPRDTLEIPANGEFTFEPGGFHVMLDGLKSPLEEGQVVQVTAEFRDAGAITFDATVYEGGSEHSGH